MSEEKPYSEMSRKELEDKVKDIHDKWKKGEMSHEERHKHTGQLYLGYQSGKRDVEYNEMFSGVESGENLEKLSKLYGGLRKEHAEKGGDLGDTAVTEWIKKFADTVLPPLKMGNEGQTQQNYTTLMIYLSEWDRVGGEGNGEKVKEIKEAIRKGHGSKASSLIIEAIRGVQQSHDLNDFYNFLLPDDAEHRPFREYAAQQIANEAEKHLPEGEKGKKFISQALISQKLPMMYQFHAAGNYGAIINAAKVDKKEQKK
jgi:hypothetical protein